MDALWLLLGWILCSLANQQIVEVVRHGSLFNDWMNRRWQHWHLWSKYLEQPSLSPRQRRLGNWIMTWNEAWLCGFCFSHYPALLLILLWWACPNCGTMLIFWLATVRTSQILNDLLHNMSRSPARSWIGFPVNTSSEDIETDAHSNQN